MTLAEEFCLVAQAVLWQKSNSVFLHGFEFWFLLQIEKVFIKDPNDFKVKQYKNIESEGKYCSGDIFSKYDLY